MTTYGLTPTGFVAKPLAAILADMQAAQIAALGTDWDVSAESPEGQLNAIVATAISQLWELAAAVYAARDPNGATYAALDAVAQLTGTQRQKATQGTVTLRVNLNAGVTLPPGSLASVTGQPSNLWFTVAPATNSGGAPADVIVNAKAALPGAFHATAGQIAVIASPFVGWNSVTNDAAAVTGLVDETDAVLRSRRVTELATGGGSTADAIVANVLKPGTGVVSCSVFVNDTDLAVAGPPALSPHSLMVLIYDGSPGGTLLSDAACAALIWKEKPTGVGTLGASSANTPDVNSVMQLVHFQRPVVSTIYFVVTVVKGPRWDAVATPAIIAKAFADYGTATCRVGTTVVRSLFMAVAALGYAPTGDPIDSTLVASVTDLRLGTAPAPVGTADIAVGALGLATFDPAHVTVIGT